jgi:hypothetical protein
MTNRARLFLSIGGTLAAGILGARLVSHGAPANAAPGAERDAPRSESKQLVTAALGTARLATLEARVAALESGSAQAPQSAQAAPNERSGAVEPPRALHTPEERQKRIAADYALFEQHLEAHRMSPRDETWASKMEAKLATGVKPTTGDAKFKYEGADCRSNTCTVNFSWPSKGAAETDIRKVLSALASSGCTREIALPPDDGSEGPTKNSVLLTCQPSSGR